MSLAQGKNYKAEEWKPPEGLDIDSMVSEVGKPMEKPEIQVDVEVKESEIVGVEAGEEEEQSFNLKTPRLSPAMMKVLAIAAGVLVVFILVGMISSKKKPKKDENPTPQESTYQPPVELNVFHYTIEELAELRNNGYTAEEAEYYESLEIPAESLILDAQQKRQELYESEMAPYMDVASEEYKELAADSWVGQQAFEVGGDLSDYRYYSEVWNVDYKKLPARGSQLFIKLVSPEGEVLFMSVTPEQYLNLRDTGNIVVNVKYTQMNADVKVITEISEKKISN